VALAPAIVSGRREGCSFGVESRWVGARKWLPGSPPTDYGVPDSGLSIESVSSSTRTVTVAPLGITFRAS